MQGHRYQATSSEPACHEKKTAFNYRYHGIIFFQYDAVEDRTSTPWYHYRNETTFLGL